MLASTLPAAHETPIRNDHRAYSAAVGVILVAWLGIVVAAAATGQFVTPVGQPPLLLLAAVVVPVIVFGSAYGSFAGFREFVRAGDPEFLTTIQSWRVLGGIFLVMHSFSMLPAAFAIPAGWGDVAIGVTAPFAARMLARRGAKRAGPLFATWQYLGILDLIVAVGVGASLRTFEGLSGDVLQSERMVQLSELPLSLIPTFAVPLFVILHLASLAQYRARLRPAPPCSP